MTQQQENQIEKPTFQLSDKLEEYFKNWKEGYSCGVRDAEKPKVVQNVPNNFVAEGDGFMGGYILGFGSRLEKLKGLEASKSFYGKFHADLREGKIAFVPHDEAGNPMNYQEWLKKNQKNA